VLYTDVDVLFRRDVARTRIRPRIVACAPEFEPDEYAYFNSGVMIINVPALRKARADLEHVLRKSLPGLNPWDDQGLLNNTLHGAGTGCRAPGIGNLIGVSTTTRQWCTSMP